MDATSGDPVVTLLPWEVKFCADVASLRMAISDDQGMNHASTYERSHVKRLEEEYVGACAELAAAKFLNRYWYPSINTFHNTPDLAPNVEIRSSVNPEASLIVRDNDPDDRWYVLVVGTPPVMTIAGCMQGKEAKNPEWLRNPRNLRPSYFVPQSALRKANAP